MHPPTLIALSPWSLQLWDFVKGESLVLFSGHRSAVTCLEFSEMGTNLISGSQDTDIIVWDVINEAGSVPQTISALSQSLFWNCVLVFVLFAFALCSCWRS